MSRTRLIVVLSLLLVPASGARLKLRSSPEASHLPFSDPKVCEPPCAEGQGVCNNNQCFCRSPYRGSSCQSRSDGLQDRLPMSLSIGLCAGALFFGCLAGGLCQFGVDRLTGKDLFTSNEDVRQEVWYRAS